MALGPQDIANLEIEVTQQDGVKMVRVGDIATIDETMGLSSIARREQQRTVTVTLGRREWLRAFQGQRFAGRGARRVYAACGLHGGPFR